MSSSAPRHASLTSSIQLDVSAPSINTYRGKNRSPKEQILTLLELKGNLNAQQFMWYLETPYDKIIGLLRELEHRDKKIYSIPPYNGGAVLHGTKWFMCGGARFDRVLEEAGVELKPEPANADSSTLMKFYERMVREKKVLPFPLDHHILKFLRGHPKSTARKILYHFGVRPTLANVGVVKTALNTLERGNRAYSERLGGKRLKWSAR